MQLPSKHLHYIPLTSMIYRCIQGVYVLYIIYVLAGVGCEVIVHTYLGQGRSLPLCHVGIFKHFRFYIFERLLRFCFFLFLARKWSRNGKNFFRTANSVQAEPLHHPLTPPQSPHKGKNFLCISGRFRQFKKKGRI